jgi:hypothetical protein
MVNFNVKTQAIECSGCGDHIPLARQTIRDPFRFTEHMEMAKEVHADCTGTPYEAQLQRRWREAVLLARNNGGRSPERIVCSV